jgi:PAS domain S-box-containing protein
VAPDPGAWGSSELGRRVQSMDWSQTSLGPLPSWPGCLRTLVGTCLSSRRPMFVAWGPELVLIYNDACAPILRDKHPRALGARAREVWPEVWNIIGPMLQQVMAQGQASCCEDRGLLLRRGALTEQCYFTCCVTPAYVEGGVRGVSCAFSDTTQRVLAQRRLATLRAITTGTLAAFTLEELCSQLGSVLAKAEADVPFAVLYVRSARGLRAEPSSVAGLTPSSVAALPGFDVSGQSSSPIAAAMRGADPSIVHDLGSFGHLELSEAGVMPTSVMCLALRGRGDGEPVAVLVVGLSPYLPLTPEYRAFFSELASEIGRALPPPAMREPGIARQAAPPQGLGARSDHPGRPAFDARSAAPTSQAPSILEQPPQTRGPSTQPEQPPRRPAGSQKAHLVSLFAHAPTPIVILRGPSYVIELVNDCACRLWGRTREQLLDRQLFRVLPELEEQGLEARLERARTSRVRKEETPTRFQRRGDGKSDGDGASDNVYLNLVFSALPHVDDETDGILVMGLDVTDEVVARNEVDVLRAQAESASRTKDEFLAMLGHELRNPLSPMLTALQLMRVRGQQSREQDILERQVAHLTRLVDDLLDVSRITRGQLALQKQSFELLDVIARAIELASPLLEQRRDLLDVDVPQRGLGVCADRERLAQVFSNLLTNAAKYSEPGSRIWISARREGNKVQAQVTDEGVGIAPEMLGEVFGLFVQQPQTIERSRGGLGLGLTIVRSLVELHGGSVSVRSLGVGHGSQFRVELPAVELAESAQAAASASATALGTVPQPVAHSRRILVVDDNQDAADTLKEVLTALGHDVLVAHDGPAALRNVEAFDPDIALLDIGLPVMDGYELAQHLRELREQSRPLRLVAVTGYGQESDRKRSREAGFAEHLVKPVDLNTLQHVVEQL